MPAVILTEAPLDALTLAACGLPALALCGKDMRPWLRPKLAFRRVFVALDADGPGDEAAGQWVTELRRFGADVHRLRPEGGKDWNEVLTTHSRCWLYDWLWERTGPPSKPVHSLMEEVCRTFAPVVILDD